MKNELVAVKKELMTKYSDQTSGEYVLSSITEKIMTAAQTAIDKANETRSYDEKIQTLVDVVQEIVAICAAEKSSLQALHNKYTDQSEIIEVLINRTDSPEEE